MAIVQGPGLSIGGALMVWLKYNDNKNKLHSVEWDLPAGHVARITMWEDDIEILDRTVAAGKGTANVPSMKFSVVDGDLVVPANIKYRLHVQTI